MICYVIKNEEGRYYCHNTIKWTKKIKNCKMWENKEEVISFLNYREDLQSLGCKVVKIKIEEIEDEPKQSD